MPWLSYFAALLGIGAAIGLSLESQRTRLSRRFRRGKQLYSFLYLGSLILTFANLASAFGWLAGRHKADLIVLVTLLFFFVVAGLAMNYAIIPTVPSEQRRVILAVGAHPDDLEIACGGTLAKLADAGHEVHVLVMSNGAVGGDQDIRGHEAMRGARFMGALSVKAGRLPDTRLSESSNEMVALIEQRIGELDPDVLFTHSEHDQHQDHHAVHLATLRAARRHSSILCFESPSATRKFNPAVFIDIEDYLDVKVNAVAQHQNQMGKPYMSADNVRGIAAFRGNQAKTQFAEGFEAVRLLGSSVGVF